MRFGRTEITPGFFLVIAALLFFDTDGLVFHGIAAAVVHETAHLVVASMLGGKIAGIRLAFAGAEMELAGTFTMSHASEALIYLSGPAANILTAFAASWAANVFGLSELCPFAGLNLALGLFNILPCEMLDGGGVLRTLCLHFLGRVPAVVHVLHVLTVLALVFASGLLVFANAFNLSLLLASAYVLASAVLLKRPVFGGCQKSGYDIE